MGNHPIEGLPVSGNLRHTCRKLVKITAFLMTHSHRSQKFSPLWLFWLINSSATGLAVWEVSDVDDRSGVFCMHSLGKLVIHNPKLSLKRTSWN